ncbi:hypothetical protein EX30DRAFT_249864 [Ascodesmis nigricans]|uniref:BHLH domain-containing protein n=1 Tax=Ascodesmis nigricans TaxID=341454 RepID=A0A4S2MYB5_9PEZI|nr:hypothetical protein EX30DRAFT_249864 [Ascodesmis nigricans]
MDAINYDSCAQFLARLDQNAENASLDDSFQSPSSYDARGSLSPPGLSSGSVTSHSPESVRYDWDPSDNSAFFAEFDDVGILSNDNAWGEPLISPASQIIDPMSDYIKIENHPSPNDYDRQPQPPQSQQQQPGTISPDSSLIDPTAPSAVEGRGFLQFGSDRASDPVFDFNGYSTSPTQARRQNSTDYPQYGWSRPQEQRNEFPTWQAPPPPPPPHHQPPQLPSTQPQLRSPIQAGSPLRHSMSPTASHSSPDSRADSHSDDNAPAPRSKKRKTSTDDSGEGATATSTPTTRKQPKKTAHNMIEKRYRTNLNDKIAALRDSVPSLRIMAGTSKMGEDDEEEDLEGLAPAHKLNKATVLAKATEYIRHLEKRNKRLHEENDQLKNRLNAFEKLAMGGGMNPQLQHPGVNGPRGPPTGAPGGGMLSRLMVGSLAGLMVMNGFQQSDSSDSRQLFAIPTAAFEWMGVSSPSAQANELMWLMIKLMLLVAAAVYVITPGFFDRRPAAVAKAGSSRNNNVPSSPSPASPIEDRTHAWLTAIQTVWVPRHSVGLEMAAVTLKFVKLGLRRLIGWERYCMLTGLTAEQEQARIKSWTIACDAQLTGGDLSINHSRLLLTLLASWTTPSTPARLMLNALHIRVLFYDLGASFQKIAESLSNRYWLEARKMQARVVAGEKDSNSEALPENLAQLLQRDPADVFNSVIIQKAHDLAYNRNTCDYVGIDEGFDNVVKDAAVRSPLDALAAWYSSLILHGVFVDSLKAKTSPSVARRIQKELDIALHTAPASSAAHFRALAANAVLSTTEPEQHLYAVTKLFEEDLKAQKTESSVSMSKMSPQNTAVTTTADIRITIRCAMALALMKKGSQEEATRLFSDLDWRRPTCATASMGLLGFVAAWKTLTTFVSSESIDWANTAGEAVDRAAAKLRIWIGDKKTLKLGVAKTDCKKIIDFCNGLQKQLAGIEANNTDDGYCSGSNTTEVAIMVPHIEA